MRIATKVILFKYRNFTYDDVVNFIDNGACTLAIIFHITLLSLETKLSKEHFEKSVNKYNCYTHMFFHGTIICRYLYFCFAQGHAFSLTVYDVITVNPASPLRSILK